MELINKTQFIAERIVLQDREGRELLVVIIKCTFALKGNSSPVLAEEQLPIQKEDTHYGKPGESSVRYESDLAPYKLGTDIILNGHGYAPRGKARSATVAVKVGSIAKSCMIFGNRRWAKFGGYSISEPEYFDRIPLVYEKAFGGKDVSAADTSCHQQEARNPIGCGFLAKKTSLNPTEISLPNIEDPAELIRTPQDRPMPAGFGFTARHWQPRVSYAGTYGKDWMENRAPLLPVDFDDRYFSGAHPHLISQKHLQGGESVEIINAVSQGALRFSLPQTKPEVEIVSSSLERAALNPLLDTLILEPDQSRIVMVWRVSRMIHKELRKIACIRVMANG